MPAAQREVERRPARREPDARGRVHVERDPGIIRPFDLELTIAIAYVQAGIIARGDEPLDGDGIIGVRIYGESLQAQSEENG